LSIDVAFVVVMIIFVEIFWLKFTMVHYIDPM
jgi:hypothetical protein